MNEWQIFHAYRRLSDAGKVKPLVCPDDDTILITQLGPDDKLVLWCMLEDRYITPGIDLRDRVLAVVREHTED